jgi:hypothetical protein
MKKLPLANPFADLTRRLLQQRHERGYPLTIPFLSEIWESLVGEELAAHTRPHLLDDEGLEILVTSDLWIAELKRHEPELRRRLNVILPKPLKALRFLRDPSAAPPKPRARARSPRLGNLPQAEKQLIEEIEDEEIRTLVTRVRRLGRGRGPS